MAGARKGSAGRPAARALRTKSRGGLSRAPINGEGYWIKLEALAEINLKPDHTRLQPGLLGASEIRQELGRKLITDSEPENPANTLHGIESRECTKWRARHGWMHSPTAPVSTADPD